MFTYQYILIDINYVSLYNADRGKTIMFRWVGLGLAVIGVIVAVPAVFNANFQLAFIFGLLALIGMFILSRPNL